MKMPFVISKRGKLERKETIILKSRQVGATTLSLAMMEYHDMVVST